MRSFLLLLTSKISLQCQWGFNHIHTKRGIEIASDDFGFTMIAYNLKRMINIVGMESLRKFLVEFSGIFAPKLPI